MITALEIRRKLEAVLQGRIGEYTLTDGTKRPAVWLGGKVSSKVASTSGIEVLIGSTPSMPTERIMSSETIVNSEHLVRLVQHTSNASLSDALLLVVANFELAGNPVVLEETDSTYLQASIRIKDSYVVRKQ